jgi:CRP-like cAMP-binding protein
LGLGRAATLADIDALALRAPALAGLSSGQREALAARTRVHTTAEGTAIIRRDDASSDAYFIIEGRTVASREEDGQYRSLEILNAGDFFGEIAALTGMMRTANVIAEQPTVLLQVPAATLRDMMKDTNLNRLFLTRMTERMVRMNMVDLPQFAGIDQQSLRELRVG